MNSGRPMTRKHGSEQRKSRPLRISEEETVSLYKVVISVLPFAFMGGVLKGAKKYAKAYHSDVLFSSCCFQ